MHLGNLKDLAGVWVHVLCLRPSNHHGIRKAIGQLSTATNAKQTELILYCNSVHQPILTSRENYHVRYRLYLDYIYVDVDIVKRMRQWTLDNY